MKIFILADIEGAAGVTNYAKQCEPGGREYSLAKTWLTSEVNAAIAGICDESPDSSIVVWDGHGESCVHLNELDERAEYIPRGPFEPPYGLDESFDGFFFVGQHARASSGGVLCHSYTFACEGMWLNGVEVGEFGCRAAMAGVLGVPMLFLSGDDFACREAEELIPGIITVTTKKTINENLAVTLHPRRACELIREGARKAIQQSSQVKPFKINPPYEQKIRLKKPEDFDRWFANRPATVEVEALDNRTGVLRADNLFDLHI